MTCISFPLLSGWLGSQISDSQEKMDIRKQGPVHWRMADRDEYLSSQMQIMCFMCLTVMLLVANLVNMTSWQKAEKWLKPWKMGTHLSKSFPMNTNMTGFRCFSKKFSPCALDESFSIGMVRTIIKVIRPHSITKSMVCPFLPYIKHECSYDL